MGSYPQHGISPQHSQWLLLLLLLQQAAKRVWPEKPASLLQTQRPVCLKMPAQPHNARRRAASFTVEQEPRQRGRVQSNGVTPKATPAALGLLPEDWDRPYLKKNPYLKKRHTPQMAMK